jgi:predicted nucleic acid-binding protein
VVATTASLDAEALYGARGPAEYEQLWADRRAAYEYLPTNDEDWQSALSAQRDLARQGQHRAVGVADLLTATLAATHHLTVVHYDADFETAATVLAFQHQWGRSTRVSLGPSSAIAPRSTLLPMITSKESNLSESVNDG